jgi:hypothetical protein
MISIVKDINNVVVTEKEQLEKMCCNFYNKLYKVGKLSLRQEKLRANAPKSIPRNYLQCDEFMFNKQISLKEVHLFARSMAKGKSLGLNKFVIKFYTFVWDLIEELFFKMIDAVIKEGCLPSRMNKNLITLLFKSSEKENLSSWCWIIFKCLL